MQEVLQRSWTVSAKSVLLISEPAIVEAAFLDDHYETLKMIGVSTVVHHVLYAA